MTKPPKRAKREPTVKSALIKMALAAIVLLGLSIICLRDIDGGLRATLIVFMAIVVLPSVILFGIDASRAIKREQPQHGPLRLLAATLIFPQAMFGIVLIATALVLPFVSIRAVAIEAAEGRFAAMRAYGLLLSPLFLVLGCHYLWEGLGAVAKVPRRIRFGRWEMNAPHIPTWLMVLIVADGISIGTLLLAYIVAAIATTQYIALRFWQPAVSISVAIVAVPLALRLVTSRQRRSRKSR